LHLAEAEMMTRKLSRSAAKPAAPPEAATGVAVKPGGPYRGFITTNLIPGRVFPGTWTINKDGTVDSTNEYGDRSHGTINSADPNIIVSVSAHGGR
jgi:hypothetical protein